MADDEGERSSVDFKHPQIIFIRLGKDKSKDAIQNEVFKCIRKALSGSETPKSDPKKEKNYLVLPDIESRDVQDVALGEEFIGLLLKDGRVCRYKCVCSNFKSSSRRSKSQSSSEGPVFQVQSDEAYARRLQEQLNSDRGSGSAAVLRASGLSNSSEGVGLGLQEPSFRAFYPLNESGLLESERFPTDTSSSLSNLLNIPHVSARNSAALVTEENEETNRSLGQNLESLPEAISPAQMNFASTERMPRSSSNTDTGISESTKPGSPACGNVASTNVTKDSQGPTSWNTRSSQDNPSTNSTNSARNLASKEQDTTSSSSTSNTRTNINFSSVYNSSQSMRSSAPNTSGGARNTVQSCLGFIPRRPATSPTVVQRTIFTADPYLFRPSRPVFVPSHMVIPSYPQVSAPLYTFDPRRLSTNFSSRTPMRFLQTSGRRRIGSRYESRLNMGNNGSTNEMDFTNGDRPTDDSDSEFHYPDIGELEWLQTESGEPVYFSHIAALHTEFILVEKTKGTLYHWPHTTEGSNTVAMEVDTSHAGSPTTPPDIPKAKPSPLLAELELHGERVSLVAAHRVRCTVVTKSGKVCTFYDKFIRECNNSQLPALIQQLSHPAKSFPELEGDKVTAVNCSEFLSCIATEKGKIFWWGLLPSEERQDFKHKLNKVTSDACSISVNDKVQLRQHLPGFPGALVYKSSETYGPQLGRLLLHETEEGTSQTAMKIKVEKITKSSEGSLPNSGSTSTVVNLQVKTDAMSKGVASPRQITLQEGRSASPRTNIKNQSRPSTPLRPNPHVETWEVKDVVFLESENKVLGTVAAIDGPHVIVKVNNVASASESLLRVFKVSELESVSGDTGAGLQGTSGAVHKYSSIYRGCLQNSPKCILDATRPSDPTDKEVLTGLKPVSMAVTAAGISVLVQHKESHKSFFLGPVIDQGNGEKVYTCSTDITSSRVNEDASATVDIESVPSKEAALEAVSVCEFVKTAKVGQKRKYLDSNDAGSSSQDLDESEFLTVSGNTLASSKFCYIDSQHPTLHTATGSSVVLLCDSNGCLYPRPFGTKLVDPCATQLPPLQCFGLSQRRGFHSTNNSREEKVFMVFVGFREQKLIPAIQSGIVSKVQSVLEMLELLNMSRNRGKRSHGNQGRKKMMLQDDQGNIQESRQSEEPVELPALCSEVLQCIREHTSSNLNILHVCCTNPAYMYTMHEEQGTIEKLLAGYYRAKSSSSFHGKHIEIAVLDKLLTHPIFSSEFVPMLKERDAKGCTPFMLSIQCHNFKAALYILDFVEKNKGTKFGSTSVCVEDMIFSSTFSGTTPLHALSTACTENLPPNGLGNSLTVSNLPPIYTPRILLKLFQARYPSAYRATMPPMVEEKKYPRAKTPRQRLMEKAQKEKDLQAPKKLIEPNKGSLNPPSTTAANAGPGSRPMRFGEGGNRIPIVSIRRESLQGMVTFSDPKELRQALIEMDKHMVSSETIAPEGGLTSLVQHVLHVSLTEVNNEDSDKMEMEVGIRGSVYNVSTSSGTTKISRKTQTSNAAEEKEVNAEDGLICQLFSWLISFPEMSTATNKEQETVLSFLVNNCRWIKSTTQQNQRLFKYSNKILGASSNSSLKQERGPTTEQPNPSDEITAEIKITGSSGSSTIESNLLAQLDEISSSFKSLVDTLASLEGRVPEGLDQDTLPKVASGNEEQDCEGAVGTSRDLIDFNTSAPTEENPEVPNDENLPILIQLAQNWSCVAATVLGHFPVVTPEGTFEGLEVEMNEGLMDISDGGSRGPSRATPSVSCNIDAFVYELLMNANRAVLVTFVKTIITEMNKYPTELILETTQKGLQQEGPYTASRVAISVGMKFLRAVIRQMSVHLSRSGVSYVDLRSRIGPCAQSTLFVGSEQNNNLEFKKKVRMILRSFSWLGIYELVQAAEATVLPVREGVVKAQARSTGASISNNVPPPNVFPGARYRGARPGIRVSQYDSRSSSQEPMLRTAYRIPESHSAPVSRCRGIRLAALSDISSSPIKRRSPSPQRTLERTLGYFRSQDRRGSLMDSDSDTDEDDGPLLRRGADDDSDMELEEGESSSVSMATGLNREHPYAWALDGRLSGFGDQGVSSASHISFTHYITNIVTPPSVHTGNCYLTRMFSRLIKEAVDLIGCLCNDETSSAKVGAEPDEPVIQVLAISSDESTSIKERVTSVLDSSWVWLAKILDVVEGQLHRGRHFDTKRYLASFQRFDESDLAPLPRSSTSMPGASPEEYLMFLLRAHNHEHSDTLPVIDMLCYEHMVYILDTFIYSINNWPKPDTLLNRSISSISSLDGEELTSALSSSDLLRSEPGTSTIHPRPRSKHSKETEACIKFYGMDVTGKEKENFLTNLQATLEQKSRMMVPKATWEVFTHNVGVSRLKSVDDVSHGEKTGNDEGNELPVTYGSVSSLPYPTPLVINWSVDQVIERWKIAVDLFSRLFLADGPGAERDSFLAARAGVAGRLARFRRTMLYLRESVTADSQQSGLAFGGLGGRVGTTLSIAVKRTRLLADTLRILGEMQPFHYSNFRAKFEGEEGSGPGVNRGFFAAVANACKGDDKLPPETTSLLHEPGKLPEQSGFYAPKPFAYTETSRSDSQVKARRLKMYTAIGRFIGLSLWFNNTVPLNFSRHVIKFLLNRDVTWEDLAFFNADLFEGLSRMMIDASHPLASSDSFQATYCCHFETSVGGTTEELVPGGSQLPVTPDNIFKYVRLYATKVMTGCVENELKCMRNGLSDVIPSELLIALSPEDFQLLLSGGTTDIDMSKLRSVITFTNSNGCSKDILERFKRWFWSIVQKMTPLQRQQLLYFCTGSAVLPVMNDSRDPDQDLSITVDVISGNTKALPMATTCGQRMSVPLYPSKRILRKKLLQAIQCQSYGLG